MANFRDKGVPRRRRLLLSASFILFCVGSALVAFFVLRGAGESVKMAALVFVAGLLTVAAVEDMLEEAHEAREDDRGSVLAFVGGFTLFTLVSAGLETVTVAKPAQVAPSTPVFPQMRTLGRHLMRWLSPKATKIVAHRS